MSGRSTSRRHRLNALRTGPFWEGASAYELGKDRSVNPYGGPTQSRGKAHSWSKGWQDARRRATQGKA